MEVVAEAITKETESTEPGLTTKSRRQATREKRQKYKKIVNTTIQTTKQTRKNVGEKKREYDGGHMITYKKKKEHNNKEQQKMKLARA